MRSSSRNSGINSNSRTSPSWSRKAFISWPNNDERAGRCLLTLSTRFGGFRAPQYTQTPNEFFDVLAPKLTEAELRVLIYIIRRTFGFHRDADAISVSQMVSGISSVDGEILDSGTGMSKSAVWRGTKGLVEKGVLQVARLQNPDGEYETNVYSLRFAEEAGVSLQESNPISLGEQGCSSPGE